MRILALDMGTGPQHILLYDSERSVENCVKMVMPSATEIAARRIRGAMQERSPILLTGCTAGGGPCSWALDEFIAAGGRAYATPEAARTFDDDLDRVREMGVEIVADDETRNLRARRIALRDLDLDAIRTALAAFEEPAGVDGLALGCLDHGAAPAGVSDRLFRFQHLQRVVSARNDLLAFACSPEKLPDYLTRARSMVAAGIGQAPVAFMDTGPAAALGALHDEQVARHSERVVVNLGNMHLLGFHLSGRKIASLYEHHTGELSSSRIVELTLRLASVELRHEEVFDSKGHGAYHHDRGLVTDQLPAMVAVTGPQRHKVRGSRREPFFAAPFGDMMISGCFGILRAFAEVHEWAREAIDRRLGSLN